MMIYHYLKIDSKDHYVYNNNNIHSLISRNLENPNFVNSLFIFTIYRETEVIDWFKEMVYSEGVIIATVTSYSDEGGYVEISPEEKFEYTHIIRSNLIHITSKEMKYIVFEAAINVDEENDLIQSAGRFDEMDEEEEKAYLDFLQSITTIIEVKKDRDYGP